MSKEHNKFIYFLFRKTVPSGEDQIPFRRQAEKNLFNLYKSRKVPQDIA